MLTKRVAQAPQVWNQLHGVINVFKPAGIKSTRAKYTVVGNLIRGKLRSLKLLYHEL